MVYNIFTYQRPVYVKSFSGPSSNSPSGSESVTELQSFGSNARGIAGIPGWLSFDRIVEGATCPPVTCRDFMNYLLYVEHCAENLQFYLWYRDYLERFEKLPGREQELSPEYTNVSETISVPPTATRKHGFAKIPRDVQQFVNDTFAKESARNTSMRGSTPSPIWTPRAEFKEDSPCFTPLRTPPPVSRSGGSGGSNDGTSRHFSFSENSLSLSQINYKQAASEAFESANHKWQPFSIQPFRDEISRIIAIYLAEGSPRELNLSDRDRTAVIKALAQTTHPSALRQVKSHIEDLLRFQSHPNFIRWSICNGNRQRGIFAIWLGVACIALGLIASVVITLGSAGRGWRTLGAFGWMIGGSTLFAATKGMCIVLHGRHRRHVRPWELWTDDKWGCEMRDSKESFETSESNSYEDEPWAEKYRRRSLIRKIFDKEVYIEEPALRQIQDTIAIQALLLALVGSAGLSGVFIAIPHGNFY